MERDGVVRKVNGAEKQAETEVERVGRAARVTETIPRVEREMARVGRVAREVEERRGRLGLSGRQEEGWGKSS